MKIKVTPKLEADQRSKRKAYRRARKSALARLREGMDLRWTPPRSRDEVHERADREDLWGQTGPSPV